MVSYSATGPYTVQFIINKAYNPTWLLYNELSQITPMPLAWDTTTSALGPTTDNGNLPDTTPAGASAVYTNLNGLAKNTGSYASSPIWAVVDGPFKLTDFTNTGEADFVPNPSYTGPVKAEISEFKELPFTDASRRGERGQDRALGNLTVGYLPVDQHAPAAQPEALGYKTFRGLHLLGRLLPAQPQQPEVRDTVFQQQYFRQAFQYLVDQKGWINAFEKGYAQPTYGPIPLNPANTFLSLRTARRTPTRSAPRQRRSC